jgi:hypothetical protein
MLFSKNSNNLSVFIPPFSYKSQFTTSFTEIANTIETKSTITFDNQYVLSRIEENKISKNLKTIQELKQIAPLLSDVELLQLYNKSILIHQSKIQGNGGFLEF